MKIKIKMILKYTYNQMLKLFFTRIYQTKDTAAPIRFKTLFFQKILRINYAAYWPTHFTSTINNPRNIKIGIGTAPGLSPGCYIQGTGKIEIGNYTIIAPNVGIISANHDILNYTKHSIGSVKIGNYCWIGMNAVILPNVILGDCTIVGANSVVTKSFQEGYCVIAGNPAKVVKLIKKGSFNKTKNDYEYVGYIKKEKFDSFKKNYLNE